MKKSTSIDLTWEEYCPTCFYYDSQLGACSEIHENIRSYPNRFNKCNGKYYELDKDKKIVLLEKKVGSFKKEADTIDHDISDQQLIIEKGMFSAEGRIRRSTYWTRWLIAMVISFAGGFISGMDESLAILSAFVSIAVTIFMIIQGVKRMHDVNKSGWYILIPIYNLILLLTDGTPGANEYGGDPKGNAYV